MMAVMGIEQLTYFMFMFLLIVAILLMNELLGKLPTFYGKSFEIIRLIYYITFITDM